MGKYRNTSGSIIQIVLRTTETGMRFVVIGILLMDCIFHVTKIKSLIAENKNDIEEQNNGNELDCIANIIAASYNTDSTNNVHRIYSKTLFCRKR